MTNKCLGDADIRSLCDSGNKINKITLCSETLFICITEKTFLISFKCKSKNIIPVVFKKNPFSKVNGVVVIFALLLMHVWVCLRGYMCVCSCVHALLINVSLHVLFVYVLAYFSFFFLFSLCLLSTFSKTETRCYGDWDTCVKRKWQKRKMWLSGDTLGPWGWGWKSEPAEYECICVCVCVCVLVCVWTQGSGFVHSEVH